MDKIKVKRLYKSANGKKVLQMNNKSNVNFRLLVGTALVSGLFFAIAAQAGNLREAPELPSIEVNFGAIEKLKAEEKQLRKLEKIEAEKEAKAKAAEAKKELAEKKKAKAVAEKKSHEAKNLAKAEKKHPAKKVAAKKHETKIAKIHKKKEIKIAHAKVKPAHKVAEKVIEQPKIISEKIEAPKIIEKVEAPKLPLPEVMKPEPIINTVAKNEQPNVAPLKLPVDKEPEHKNNIVVKNSSGDLQKVEKNLKPETKVATFAPAEKHDLPPVTKHDLPPVKETATNDNSPSFLAKISDFFAAKPVEPVAQPAPAIVPPAAPALIAAPKAPLLEVKKIEAAPEKPAEKIHELEKIAPHEEVEDEEEIAAKEYAKHEEDLEKFNENISSETAAADNLKEENKNIILPNKIDNAAAPKPLDPNAPPIPQLADLVELKREEPAKPAPKAINDEEWKGVLDDAKKKASGVAPETVTIKEPTPAPELQPIVAPKGKEVTTTSLPDLKAPEPKPEKVSIISSVLDWMPSFSGNKAKPLTENSLQIATSPVASGEKPIPVKPENLSVKTSENEVLSQNSEENKTVDIKPDATKTIELAEVKKSEAIAPVAEVKTPVIEAPKEEVKMPVVPDIAPMPQIETVALPTNLNPKAQAISINFKAAEVDFSEADKTRLADFVKKIVASKDKVKIVSTSPSIDNDVNAARRISLKRAIAIRAQMIEYGLDSGRINVQAIGNQDGNSINGVNILVFDGSAS
jgi:hypothetical protein